MQKCFGSLDSDLCLDIIAEFGAVWKFLIFGTKLQKVDIYNLRIQKQVLLLFV